MRVWGGFWSWFEPRLSLSSGMLLSRAFPIFFCRYSILAHIIALQFQKGFFSLDSSSISGQTPVRSYHSMARYNDADWIMSDCAADSLCRHLFEPALLCNLIGNPPICHRLPIRDLAHNLSDTIAEIGAHQMDLREKTGITTRKINIQPFFRLIKIARFTAIINSPRFNILYFNYNILANR